MAEKGKVIRKEWCVYGAYAMNVGRIVDEGPKSVHIQYLEGQMYPPELWDDAYVTRFDTLEEAGEAMRDHVRMPDNKLREYLFGRFPSYFKEKGNEDRL